jgi:hypothetical protein
MRRLNNYNMSRNDAATQRNTSQEISLWSLCRCVNYFLPGCITVLSLSKDLLSLRRTLHRSVLCSAIAPLPIAIGITRSNVIASETKQAKGRTLHQLAPHSTRGSVRYSAFLSRKDAKFIRTQSFNVIHLCAFAHLRLCVKSLVLLCAFVSSCFHLNAQRQDISLNNDWLTSLSTTNTWKKVDIPHNWDDYYGYRRLVHGNLHGDAIYKKNFIIEQPKQGKRFFLFFEGVGSYATVYVNDKLIGSHAGGRTTFTLDITDAIKTDGSQNNLAVKVSHPSNIKDLPWVCGGCSDERGFSEGSQPLGIFRPVHLVITNEACIVPFGVNDYEIIN